MTDRVEVTTGNGAPAGGAPAGGDQRPAWLPENFKTPEDLAKAYSDAQAKITQLSQAPKSDGGNATITVEGSPVASAAKEMIDNGGKLSESTTKSLAAKGITVEDVRLAAAGATAQSREITQTITKAAGGAENLEAIKSWAKANMSAAELESYNRIVNGGDPLMAGMAFDALVNRYTQATGLEPALLRGEGALGRLAGVEPFASQAEMVRAMQDPKYENDSAYRAEVEKRVFVTPMSGIRG